MSNVPLRIIQISDTHLFADESKVLVGVPTQQSLQAVIDLIKREAGEFDFIIHSGDLTQDYSQPSYIRLVDMLSTLNAPMYCIPGNHDDSGVMAKVFPYLKMSNDKHIVTKNWQIILLDSHKPNAVEGYLEPKEFQFLEKCLTSYPDHQAVIVFHHQPIPVGSLWLDNLGLTNADEFWKIIARFPKVNTVLFGHVHQQFEKVVNSIKCYSTPSTCFQFKRHQDDFGIEKLSPGFRWVHLYEDGSVQTEVVRTEHYIGVFEEKCKGY